MVFLDHVLLMTDLAQKFKLLQKSCIVKGFLTYETLTIKIEIILSYKGRVSNDKYIIHICNTNFYGNLMTATDKQRSVA